MKRATILAVVVAMLCCSAAVGAARLSDALGEEHEDLSQEAIAAAPWSGQTPPQHSGKRERVEFGIQTQAST